MATVTKEEKTRFIEQIAKYVKKYAPQYGIKVNSPIIAQAILESGWGKSQLAAKYHNYFGLKCGSKWTGKSVNVTTHEEYTRGKISTIRDNFRVYSNMEEGVKGYFEFIQLDRYKNLKGVTEPLKYLQLIKADGYATTYTYVKSVYKILKDYGLTKYDVSENANAMKLLVAARELAEEIIKCRWIYSNSNNKNALPKAREVRNTNCANYCCLAAQKCGLFPEKLTLYSGGSTGRDNGTIRIFGDFTLSDVKKHFEVLNPRTTWKQWKQNAEPGDIVLWAKHMSIYAGSNKDGDIWYDAGKGATKDKKEKSVYTNIHRAINRSAYKVYFVFRPKR